MKLLLIDDDQVDRALVERLLEPIGRGISFTHAATGQDGLTSFAAQDFDAVLLDLMLPDMSGLDVLAELLAKPSTRVAVIILTGAVLDEARELRCLEAGAQDVLIKAEITSRHLRRALLHAQVRHSLEMRLIESREHLRVLAEHDTLTGISNRYIFDRSLRGAISRVNRTGEKLGLLLLDLDHFKMINDSMGHYFGDQLLREAAVRLLSVIREGDVLCRLGGDEFAIIAPGIDADTSMETIAERLQSALDSPFTVNGADLTVTGSMGIAMTPEGGSTADQLLKNADLAMYRAKREGRNRYHFFTPALSTELSRKAGIEKDLRATEFRSQLQLFYQPLFRASTRQVCGAEALIRWSHPTRGFVAPLDFIDVAEEFGLMPMIDDWARGTACRQMARWLSSGVVATDFRMTFNVSASSLKRDNLPLAVSADLRAAALPEGAMELEVTESVLVSNFQQSATILNKIKAFGVSIAVDDFGIGYSSLAYLKRLPASTLKIDRAFLMDVPESEADCRILKAMITMAKSLDLRVIVEGIETEGQAALCRQYGADVLQGFLLSRPIPQADFESRFGMAGAGTPPSAGL